jgi:hypothetical protein
MSREAVIRQIVEREQAGQHLSEDAVISDAPELHRAASTFFGTWDTALHYAGIDPACVSGNEDSARRYVIQRIRVLCQRGYSIKVTDVRRRDWRLYDTARRLFGKWRNALEAAGVNLKNAALRGRKPRRHDREKTLEELRTWVAMRDSASWMDLCLENFELAKAVKTVFGSLRQGLLAIGVAPSPPRRRRK